MNDIIEIIVSSPDGTEEPSLLEKESITIGKNIDCDIYLNCNRVSKVHAQIRRENDHWILQDLNSTNGTYIDGKRIREHHLKDGELFSINGYQLRVRFLGDKSKDTIMGHLKSDIENSKLSNLPESVLKERLNEKLTDLMKENNINFPSPSERETFISSKLKEILGLGSLEDYLKDPAISEIMINGLDSFYIEKEGKLISLPPVIQDLNTLQTIIDRILLPLGRRVDEASPLVDARLPDGSRIHIILPPIALHGPVLTIRKFLPHLRELKDLIRQNSLSQNQAELLKHYIHDRKNILISGGTSSGKTTLLNILCQHIPLLERIITIEDSQELKLNQPHAIYLEARPANIEGRGEITMQQLVQNALRMRPDRIIIGECRGKEAFDMVNAMNTGHNGCLTTCHANSPRDALKRLETMILMAQYELPIKCVRELIVSAIDRIIHLERNSLGHRRLTHIAEITGMEGDTILLLDKFNSTEGGDHDTATDNHE